MVFDPRAEVEDMGMVFQAVVYAITGEQRRSSSAGRCLITAAHPWATRSPRYQGYPVGVRDDSEPKSTRLLSGALHPEGLLCSVNDAVNASTLRYLRLP